jgi:hypothetical protein
MAEGKSGLRRTRRHLPRVTGLGCHGRIGGVDRVFGGTSSRTLKKFFDQTTQYLRKR